MRGSATAGGVGEESRTEAEHETGSADAAPSRGADHLMDAYRRNRQGSEDPPAELRTECLQQEIFYSPKAAGAVVVFSRSSYDHVQPYSHFG